MAAAWQGGLLAYNLFTELLNVGLGLVCPSVVGAGALRKSCVSACVDPGKE